jgi:hypothetical protein
MTDIVRTAAGSVFAFTIDLIQRKQQGRYAVR